MGWFAAPGTLGLVAEYFLKTTAVLTLALLAAAAARRRPAAFRHFVLAFALAGLLLLPVLSLAPVGWRTALLPVRPEAAIEPTLVRDAPSSPAAPPGSTEMMPAVSLPDPGETVTGRPSTDADILSPVSASPPISKTADFNLRDASPIRRQTPSSGAVNIALAVLWSAGLVVLLLRLAVGLAGAIKLTAEGKALADPVWRVILGRFLKLVSLRREVRLKSHPEVFVPLTWGWRKPVILMPAGTEGWTEEERSAALFHELCHVKRADFLVMLAVRASLAVFWWNPLCWVVYRELRKEQEIACDELVLRAGIKPSTYAASLLAFRRSAGFRWNPSAALLGMLGRSSFPERMAAILKQKLTFKEVKMRTRIMLAAAVVLAVVLVGTARPAVGVEASAAATTVVETAAPVADAIAITLPAADAQETQAEKAVVQEKEKEKAKAAEKAKEAEKEKIDIGKPVTFSVMEGGKAPIVITITEGDQVKTLTLDKPLTITFEKDGKTLVLTSEGKEIKILKSEPLRLEIRGGEIELLKEGKILRIGEGGGHKIAYFGTVEGKPAEARSVQVIKEGEAAEGAVKVVVGTAKEDSPKIAWTVKEPGKEGALWVAKEFSAEPVKLGWVSEGGKAFAFSPARDKELLEKVRRMLDQVEAVKAEKMDIAALEESLKKLEEELKANEDKLNELKIKLEREPGEFTVVKKIGEDEAKGNVIQIVFGGKGLDREAYDRALAKLKKDLPEGYKLLESNFDEKSGGMSGMALKIAPPEGKKSDQKLIRKLVDSLRAEIDKK